MLNVHLFIIYGCNLKLKVGDNLKILYLTTVFPPPEYGSTIYTDLAEELLNNDHYIKVVALDGRHEFKKSSSNKERGIDVLRIKVGSLYNVSFIRKGLSALTLKHKVIYAINKFLKNEKFDFVLFETPPITLIDIVMWLMRKYNCISFLMLKDIFPQNAIDLGILRKSNLIYWYFKYKEKLLYKNSTIIGCMSEMNRKYILQNNSYINGNKVRIFLNTERNSLNTKIFSDFKMRKKLGISDDCVLAIYGGNLGKPQGLDFLLQIINEYKNNKIVMFLIIGKGSEKNRIYKYIDNNNLKNVVKLEFLPKEDYEKILVECDIGLIFLDNRFTIPNIPSRTLTYMNCCIPIMAATDKNTDYYKMLTEANCGYCVLSGDINEYKRFFDKLINDKELRIKLGNNGKEYFQKYLTSKVSVKILEDELELLINCKGYNTNLIKINSIKDKEDINV